MLRYLHLLFHKNFSNINLIAVSVVGHCRQHIISRPSQCPAQKLQRICSTIINQIAFPDLSPTKLKRLYLYSNEISDEKADSFVAKLAASNLADSLDWLDLVGNSLTRTWILNHFSTVLKPEMSETNRRPFLIEIHIIIIHP